MSGVTTIRIFLVGLLVGSPLLFSDGLTKTAPQILRPVKTFNSRPSTAEISILSFEFQRPYLGYEGPNFTELHGEPSAGKQYLATAQLFGQEAVSTAKFELVDQSGRLIQPLHFFKQDNSLDRGHFSGSVKVPERPFRIAITGMGIDGEPYRAVHERLFRPMKRPAAPPILPKLSAVEAKRMAAALIEMEKEALAELEHRASKQPDNVIVMPRVEISNMMYQSFLSRNGNTLGMLLSYDIRFSADGDYAHSLQVFPNYEDSDTRGLIDMEVIGEEISPRPEPPSYATPQIHVDLNTLVQYGSEARFKAGVLYHFSIKLVPDFVGQNADKTKFCVDEEHYKNKVKSLQIWERMKKDSRLITYRIFMYHLAYGGETEPFDPPKTYYDGFVKEGAVKCKPYKNIYF